MIAEIFHTLLAEPADAAGVSEPGDSDSIADAVCRDLAADEVDAADDFVAKNDGIFDAGKLRIHDMKVGPAHATRAYLDANLPLTRNRVHTYLHLKRHTRDRKHHRTHLLLRNEPLCEHDNAYGLKLASH